MANKLIWSESQAEHVQAFIDKHKDEEPIREGCKNKMCFCTGKCQVIVGWKPKEKLI